MVSENDSSPRPKHNPWNKGRIIGQKRPLKPRDVWTIPVRLQLEGRKRHLALFNLAIDSKLRGCDLVRLQTDDVCVGGRMRDRATVIQKKTGRPVQFEILFIGALFLPLAIQVADIPISDFMPRRSSRGLIILLVFLVLGLMWAAAVAKGLLEPPVRCERHAGVFSKAFSANFDIDRMDCRIPSIKRSPAIHIWNGAPYFGLDWGKVDYWVSHSYLRAADPHAVEAVCRDRRRHAYGDGGETPHATVS
jgi:hypothetical protein